MGLKILSWVTVSLVLIAILGTVNNAVQKRRLKTCISDFKSKIAYERLIGKGPAEVIEFLDQKNLSHTEYQLKADPYSDEKTERTIGGKLSDVATTASLIEGPFVWDIMFRFAFDKHHKLVKYEVWESAIGL